MVKTRFRPVDPAARPFLRRIVTIPEKVAKGRHPFDIPAFAAGIDLRASVTFFVGENGSGKSTLLEAIAEGCGFNPEGGSRDHRFATRGERSELASALRLSWLPKVTDGFFLRAESFFNFASYLEEVGSNMHRYGGRSLHAQSHGESFLSLFANRFEKGVYILDEPEAALSPRRQLSLLKLIHELETTGRAQFLISTHAPILMSYPRGVIFSLDGQGLRELPFRQTDHFQITRDFLNEPERFLKHLFTPGEGAAGEGSP